MTQTSDAGGQFSRLDSSHAMGAPTSATQTRAKFGTFAITYGIAFAILYTVLERLNWPFFTYHPVLGKLDFGGSRPIGPPCSVHG
jgi:ammonia channel protein AmtB